MRPVINHKTKDIYFVIEELKDCTNTRQGEEIIVYENLRAQRFARQKSEFWMKFGPIDPSDIKHIERKAD